MKNKTILKEINGGRYMSNMNSFSKDGKYIFSVSLFDSTFRVANLETGEVEKKINLPLKREE